MFVCQQPGSFQRWTVSNLPGGISNDLVNSVASSQAGRVSTFTNDPYGFEIHVLPSSSNVISELRVTAVKELNGATVECRGDSGSFMSTIQIMSGDLRIITVTFIYIINTVKLISIITCLKLVHT